MHYNSDTSLNEIREQLVNRLMKLKEERGSLKEENPILNENRVNDNAAIDTEAAEDEEQLRIGSLIKELDESINRVIEAIRRIDEGIWGKCSTCGKKISDSRLHVDPTVEECIDCSRKMTRKNEE